MRAQHEAIVAAGLDLQLDCPDLALSRHMLFTDLSDDEFVDVAESHVNALNHALVGVPAEKVRVHVRWGNYEGPHVCDIPVDKLFATLMKAKAGYLLFEPRTRGTATSGPSSTTGAPRSPTKVLAPGVVDSTTNFVEHPELVAERIGRFAGIVGPDRVDRRH
jgi:5-methyltetrahydropteroyltriglutamate--homocysteine methyltransferase